jgi:hypothetical protein
MKILNIYLLTAFIYASSSIMAADSDNNFGVYSQCLDAIQQKDKNGFNADECFSIHDNFWFSEVSIFHVLASNFAVLASKANMSQKVFGREKIDFFLSNISEENREIIKANHSLFFGPNGADKTPLEISAKNCFNEHLSLFGANLFLGKDSNHHGYSLCLDAIKRKDSDNFRNFGCGLTGLDLSSHAFESIFEPLSQDKSLTKDQLDFFFEFIAKDTGNRYPDVNYSYGPPLITAVRNLNFVFFDSFTSYVKKWFPKTWSAELYFTLHKFVYSLLYVEVEQGQLRDKHEEKGESPINSKVFLHWFEKNINALTNSINHPIRKTLKTVANFCDFYGRHNRSYNRVKDVSDLTVKILDLLEKEEIKKDATNELLHIALKIKSRVIRENIVTWLFDNGLSPNNWDKVIHKLIKAGSSIKLLDATLDRYHNIQGYPYRYSLPWHPLASTLDNRGSKSSDKHFGEIAQWLCKKNLKGLHVFSSKLKCTPFDVLKRHNLDMYVRLPTELMLNEFLTEDSLGFLQEIVTGKLIFSGAFRITDSSGNAKIFRDINDIFFETLVQLKKQIAISEVNNISPRITNTINYLCQKDNQLNNLNKKRTATHDDIEKAEKLIVIIKKVIFYLIKKDISNNWKIDIDEVSATYLPDVDKRQKSITDYFGRNKRKREENETEEKPKSEPKKFKI